MPFLVVKCVDGSKSYPLVEGKPVYLGRAPACDIVLASPSVSRRHAVILFKDGVCGVKDLGSFNGTFLNDEPVESPQQMTERDIVKISSFIVRLRTRLRSCGAAVPDGFARPAVDFSETAKTIRL